MKRLLLTLALLSSPLVISVAPTSTYSSLAEQEDLSSLSFEEREALEAALDGFDDVQREMIEKMGALGSRERKGFEVLAKLLGATGFSIAPFGLIPQFPEGQDAQAETANVTAQQ